MDLWAEPLPNQDQDPAEAVFPPLFPAAETDGGTRSPDSPPDGSIPGDQQVRAFFLGEPPTPAAPPAPETSADLTTERLMRSRASANVPRSGWRQWTYRLTRGRINPGESRIEQWRRTRRAAATTHLRGHRRIAVLCIKGGVGKTTIAFLLGAVLAQLRGDRVIAVDANSDQGTLAGRLRTETSKTIQDLLRAPEARGYFDVRGYTSQAPSRLEVLASNEDPEVTDAFSASDFQRVTNILERYYSICISDCGTGILHDVIRGKGGVLDRTDQLIVVSNTSVNGAKKASETMDWLEENGYKELVRNSISVINRVGEKVDKKIDMRQVLAHFRSRSRAVVQVPVDDHLAEDSAIDMAQLGPATQDALLELAALVGAEFSKQPTS
ncbi:MinD/ParA family protein (plasmid) [Nocardiopsis exhalans]|uniref:MinD/ParA family protein n=1 Tax=Nocardiopsis exhalans TaxID=163604 RepID=A0ABY5DGR1_9ACTN|nr:MinD/ParA family protein [Nocardiopsis exhalans]USY23534.1 MinD/ParA family protein [Nocardiopsis exhalans]